MLREFFPDRINKILTRVLEPAIVKETIPVTGFLIKETGYKENNILPEIDSTWREFKEGDFWGKEKDSHAWFYKKISVPLKKMLQEQEPATTFVPNNSSTVEQ